MKSFHLWKYTYLFCNIIISHQSGGKTGRETKSLKTNNISMRKSSKSVLVAKWEMYSSKWCAVICLKMASITATKFPYNRFITSMIMDYNDALRIRINTLTANKPNTMLAECTHHKGTLSIHYNSSLNNSSQGCQHNFSHIMYDGSSISRKEQMHYVTQNLHA